MHHRHTASQSLFLSSMLMVRPMARLSGRVRTTVTAGHRMRAVLRHQKTTTKRSYMKALKTLQLRHIEATQLHRPCVPVTRFCLISASCTKRWPIAAKMFALLFIYCSRENGSGIAIIGQIGRSRSLSIVSASAPMPKMMSMIRKI